MIRSNLCRLGTSRIAEAITPGCYNPSRLFSKKNESKEMHFNDQQAPYYTAKDVEFCPNRAKEVMQNYVQETSDNASNDESSVEAKNPDSVASECDDDHMKLYQAGGSVSLHSVMQSNVPEPFTTKDKAPTHLNMPGSSDTQDYKYLSGKMQNTHQSKQ